MTPLLATARFLAHPGHFLGGKNVWKYLLRGVALYPWSRFWAAHLLACPQRQQLLAMQPRLLLKLQRPYLRRHAPVRLRLRWLVQHYQWLKQQWPWAFTQALYLKREYTLASIASESGTYRMVMRPTEKCDREGELILALERAGQPLALLSFSVRRDGRRQIADIGCLQGPPRELGREAVKQATQDLHGLRPKQAVLLALYALVRGYGLGGIHAVTNASHIHQARWLSRNKVQADYDQFWGEMGGVRDRSGYVLPDCMARKTLAEIPSRKRAQYRRRHELEDALISQIQAALPDCTHPSPIFHSRLVEPAANTISGGDIAQLAMAA